MPNRHRRSLLRLDGRRVKFMELEGMKKRDIRENGYKVTYGLHGHDLFFLGVQILIDLFDVSIGKVLHFVLAFPGKIFR